MKFHSIIPIIYKNIIECNNYKIILEIVTPEGKVFELLDDRNVSKNRLLIELLQTHNHTVHRRRA